MTKIPVAPPSRDVSRRELRIFLVAGEESGDRLGAALMRALRRQHTGSSRFSGIGGQAMAAEGLATLFPMNELSHIGFGSVAARLPLLLRRIREAAQAIVAAQPDVLVIIDSAGFTHRVARRVRSAAPHIPIVAYGSPQIWAWRPGRAAAMRAYVDHLFAFLPFEPMAHARLGGPPCTYIGHPLIEHVAELRPSGAESKRRHSEPPLVVVLPGSRRSEIRRLINDFGHALALTRRCVGELAVVLPTMPALAQEVRAAVSGWAVVPQIVEDVQGRYRAFRAARAALAKSGTVTLELALAAVPMVAAYKVAPWEAAIVRRLAKVPSAILANLVLGENVVPELLQEECVPDRLAEALAALINSSPDRQRQLDAFVRLDEIMGVGSARPSAKAADIVLAAALRGRSV